MPGVQILYEAKGHMPKKSLSVFTFQNIPQVCLSILYLIYAA